VVADAVRIERVPELIPLDPSPLEQEMLEHVNRMRINPAGELDVLFSDLDTLTSYDPDVTAAILQAGDPSTAELQSDWSLLVAAPPLAWNASLQAAAFGHNQQMIAADDQEHTLPGEPELADRITEAGYTLWSGLGESIFAYAQSIFHGHAGFAVDWGVPNRGHRTNIMNPDYREAGISVTPENDSGTGVGPLVVTEDFGNRYRFGDPFALGVVYEDVNDNGRYDAGEGYGGVDVEMAGPGGTFATTTMTAGGYQLHVPEGTYTMTVSGGGISYPMPPVSVAVGTDNVKTDFVHVAIANVAPQITSLAPDDDPIDENDTVTLSGTFTDANPLDTHTVTVDWGDGTSATSATVDQTAGTFTAVHRYLDDNTADQYTLDVTLTDDDGGTDTASTTVTVTNAAPQLTAVNLDQATIGEDGTTTVSGTFADTGSLDTHTVLVGWGDGTSGSATVDPIARTFTASHQYLDDDQYTVDVTLTDDDGGTDNASTTVTVTNADPQIIQSENSTDVSEDGSRTDTYEVVLVSRPTSDVQIAITPDDQVRVTSTTLLTFTPDNWFDPQEVRVEADDDDVDEDTPHSGTITHTVSSADARYHGINIADVTVHIKDNDTAGITVVPTSGLQTTEAGGTATFTVVLDSQPTEDATIGLSSSDTTEGTVSPAILTFTPVNWNVPQEVTVTGYW